MTYSEGIYQSQLLLSVPYLVHGFSTRVYGDMRNSDKRYAFTRKLGLNEYNLMKPKQVHSAVIDMSGDGLVSQESPLCIITADCVPILLADPNTRIVAAVHAGWKGTLGGIVSHAVDEMKRLGANPKNSIAFLGPHIGACCYTVTEERAKQFPDTSSFWESAWHIDLGLANKKQLIDCGVTRIDAPIYCTSCQTDRFFSYRKDTKETYGETIGVIGMKFV